MRSEPADPLSSLLSSLPDPDVSGAGDRVHHRLQTTLAQQNDNYAWWKRAVSIPVPLAAASAIVVALLAVVVAGGFQRGIAQTAQADAPAPDALDIKVHVDASHTSDLIDWLNEQDVGNVTIQLPDSATFDVLGEPVLVRPEELLIEPLDPDATAEEASE